jgi:hypothetical protein
MILSGEGAVANDEVEREATENSFDVLDVVTVAPLGLLASSSQILGLTPLGF